MGGGGGGGGDMTPAPQADLAVVYPRVGLL